MPEPIPKVAASRAQQVALPRCAIPKFAQMLLDPTAQHPISKQHLDALFRNLATTLQLEIHRHQARMQRASKRMRQAALGENE